MSTNLMSNAIAAFENPVKQLRTFPNVGILIQPQQCNDGNNAAINVVDRHAQHVDLGQVI